MVKVLNVREIGNQLLVTMDDDTKTIVYPTNVGLWIAGGITAITPPVDPPAGSLINPWGVGRGDPLDGWESHASYSAGGYDWSGGALSYGGPIVAPGAGVLHTSGGGAGFEYSAGNISGAGLRSILYLDTAANRKIAKSPTLMNGSTYEADGPMVAIVFQHQSAMGTDLQHYAQNETLGYVGNSGNNVTHLHVHGLDAAGRRVDFFKFC